MLETLLELRDRSIHYVVGTRPAVYYIADKDAGGVLVNAPPYDAALLAELERITPPKFLYLPSRHGAQDLDRWREACGLETIVYDAEVPGITEGTIDIVLDRKTKLSRTMDFLPMGGVTEGCCALRLKNKPGIVFFGPALTPGADGWPTLIFNDDDHSFESRLFGALGLQDLQFEYGFTDVFEPGVTQFGPQAGEAIKERVARVIEED
jgi:hypothetical protein